MITAFEQGRLFEAKRYCRVYFKFLYSSILNQVIYGGTATINKLLPTLAID